MLNVHDAIFALQQLCAQDGKHSSVIETCDCQDCQVYPRHIVVVIGDKRIMADFSLVREGPIEKVIIGFPQLGETQEYPLGVLQAFAAELAKIIGT